MNPLVYVNSEPGHSQLEAGKKILEYSAVCPWDLHTHRSCTLTRTSAAGKGLRQHPAAAQPSGSVLDSSSGAASVPCLK